MMNGTTARSWNSKTPRLAVPTLLVITPRSDMSCNPSALEESVIPNPMITASSGDLICRSSSTPMPLCTFSSTAVPSASPAGSSAAANRMFPKITWFSPNPKAYFPSALSRNTESSRPISKSRNWIPSSQNWSTSRFSLNTPSWFNSKPTPRNPNTGETFRKRHRGVTVTTDSNSNPMSTSTELTTLVHSASSMADPSEASPRVCVTTSPSTFPGSSSDSTTPPVGSLEGSTPSPTRPIADCAPRTTPRNSEKPSCVESRRGDSALNAAAVVTETSGASSTPS